MKLNCKVNLEYVNGTCIISLEAYQVVTVALSKISENDDGLPNNNEMFSCGIFQTMTYTLYGNNF